VTSRGTNGKSQVWIINRLASGAYRIQQQSSGRFLDAHEGNKNNAVVTRDFQDNATQTWVIKRAAATPPPPAPTLNGVFTIQQLSSRLFLDGWVTADRDYDVVTRDFQPNSTQRWILKPLGGNRYTIRHQTNGRYLDAWVDGNYRVVTRDEQRNNTQVWLIKPLGNNRYTLQQASNGRYMDAYQSVNDNTVMTRKARGNAQQQWIIQRVK
jgi:hypothetical protein